MNMKKILAWLFTGLMVTNSFCQTNEQGTMVSEKKRVRAIVLAAGRATRFKTKKSKMLFPICGRPMVLYPLRAVESLHIPITVVLGYQHELVRSTIENNSVKNTSFVIQKELLGTGHAVMCTAETWADADDLIILNGDMPLVKEGTLKKVLEVHEQAHATITFVTTYAQNPKGYGRVIEHDGRYTLVEEKDCTPEQRLVQEVNAGIYVINRAWLEQNISLIVPSKVTGEYYLPDWINLASQQNKVIKTVAVAYDEIRGVNTFQELWVAERFKRDELITGWMLQGVYFANPETVRIEGDVTIGAGTMIDAGVHLKGHTTIGSECMIGMSSIIDNSTIGDETEIYPFSYVQDSVIQNQVHVGPYARLRGNVVLENKAEIGNFVELKNTIIGQGSKAKHLAYLGDATIGEKVNIGAGTITCNYDGFKKHKTCIENNVFVGSNNTLVAPVCLEEGCYTAAGSTITQDVPADSLAIARARQTNKVDYVHRLQAATKQTAQKDDEMSIEVP